VPRRRKEGRPGRRSSYRTKRRTKSEAGNRHAPRRGPVRRPQDQDRGRVVSSKPDKTITVAIEVARRHPQYEKIVRPFLAPLHAHDARNEAGRGRPWSGSSRRGRLSRTKRWRLIEILEKAK